MKQCPTCQSQYTDDTLQFCLQDGSRLQSAANPAEQTPALDEQETVISNRPSNQNYAPQKTNPTNWNPNQTTPDANIQTPEKKSGTSFAVFLTAFVMLLFFGIAGIGAWLFLRGAKPDENTNLLIAKNTPNRDSTNTSSTAPDMSRSTPIATVTPSTSSNIVTNSAPPVDKEQIRKDVSQRVNWWKTAAESRDLDNYMSNYAGTVDYYNKKGASFAFVRTDKQRAFTNYDSVKVMLGNISVTPDATGENATAVFDKEWVFEGAKYSAGKVQTQLKFKKVAGKWLITGERDLKVYYTE